MWAVTQTNFTECGNLVSRVILSLHTDGTLALAEIKRCATEKAGDHNTVTHHSTYSHIKYERGYTSEIGSEFVPIKN